MSASWWRSGLRLRPLAHFLGSWSCPLLFTGTGLTTAGCAEVWTQTEPDVARQALEAQQNDGWNVGDERRALTFPGMQASDSAGGPGWQQALSTLAPRLAPAEPRWQPYYAPALFQSLAAVRSADLRLAIRPIFTAEMARAGQRGEALLSLLAEGGACRNDVALVLDIPGPEAVALASALARCFDPVFIFDNWPHPSGVVPAHLTLGAALYFLPVFEQARPTRSPTSAPMFVLDRSRMAPYSDEAGQFDNRYFAGLPAPATLQAAGIRHVLYVTPDQQVTLDADDLNDDLVALDQGGIDVKMLALSDFSQTPLPGWLDGPADPCPPVAFSGAGTRYYFGGSPSTHGCFTWWYGWPQPASAPGMASPPLAAGFHVGPVPPGLAPRCHFRPAPRPWGGLWRGHGGGASHASGAHMGFGMGGKMGGSMGRFHGGFSA